MTLSRLIARPLLASGIVVGAVAALRNSAELAPQSAKVTEKLVPLAKKAVPGAPIPEDPATLVRLNAGVQIVAALALASGRAPRLSSTVLAASLVPTTLARHRFWEESDPAAKKQQQLQFAKNLSMVGGVLIAAGDTEGRPGVAWRARHAAQDARREARHLTRSARQEARVARAKSPVG